MSRRRIRVRVRRFFKPSIGRWIKGYSYYREDTGERGRTPKSKQWFTPDVDRKGVALLGGWSKDQSQSARRQKLRNAHKVRMMDKQYANEVKREAKKKNVSQGAIGARKTFHSLIGVANVTVDKETERKMRNDAEWYIDYARRKYGKDQMTKVFATR